MTTKIFKNRIDINLPVKGLGKMYIIRSNGDTYILGYRREVTTTQHTDLKQQGIICNGKEDKEANRATTSGLDTVGSQPLIPDTSRTSSYLRPAD